MTSIGIFAGRGDVLVAMALALVFGIWIGWSAKCLLVWMQNKFKFLKRHGQ